MTTEGRTPTAGRASTADGASTAESSHPHARADFWTGLVLIVLGLAAFLACLDMPRFEEREINPYTAPGLVPGMIALVIAVLGFFLTLRAVRQHVPGNGEVQSQASAASRRRFWLTSVLTLTYAAVLVGRLPFWLATGFFVFAFVALVEWRTDRSTVEHMRALGFALAYAGIVAVVVTWVFQEIFLVRLP